MAVHATRVIRDLDRALAEIKDPVARNVCAKAAHALLVKYGHLPASTLELFEVVMETPLMKMVGLDQQLYVDEDKEMAERAAEVERKALQRRLLGVQQRKQLEGLRIGGEEKWTTADGQRRHDEVMAIFKGDEPSDDPTEGEEPPNLSGDAFVETDAPAPVAYEEDMTPAEKAEMQGRKWKGEKK